MQSPFGRCANPLVPRLGRSSSRPIVCKLTSASALTTASIGAVSQGSAANPGLAALQAAQMLSSGWLCSVQAGHAQTSAMRCRRGGTAAARPSCGAKEINCERNSYAYWYIVDESDPLFNTRGL